MARELKIACVALAAGNSRRMGVNKLLLTVNGISLLEMAIQNLRGLDVDDTFFVTGFESEKIEPLLCMEGFTPIRNWNYELGMHSSIQAGLRRIPDGFDAFLIFLCDQPFLQINDVNKMIRAYDAATANGMTTAAVTSAATAGVTNAAATSAGGSATTAATMASIVPSIAAPVFQGMRGHPVLISMKHRELILNTEGGDRGCHYLFTKFPDEVLNYEINNPGAIRDVDTPDAFNSLELEL